MKHLKVADITELAAQFVRDAGTMKPKLFSQQREALEKEFIAWKRLLNRDQRQYDKALANCRRVVARHPFTKKRSDAIGACVRELNRRNGA